MNLLALAAFNAAYADAIDTDRLEHWLAFFTEDCHYRITSMENEREGLPAGVVWADSRAMLEDRITALRVANVYERHKYRHILGLPHVLSINESSAEARVPFMVARIMANGETSVFATGHYQDRYVVEGGQLLLAERVAVCDSSSIDTLLAIPL
jgi:anthranilate 1,2-dioxygenase small subunit/terephthalate 1,2-dioxygenase oxygenase component beta subunit